MDRLEQLLVKASGISIDEPDVAIETYNLALVMGEKNIEALNGLGCAYLSSRRPQDAVRYFMMSLKVCDDIDTRTYLGRALLLSNEFEGARSQFQAILDDRPKDMYAMIGMGDVRMAEGRLDDAIGFYEQSLSKGYLAYAGYKPGRERWGIRSARNIWLSESLGRIQAYRGLVEVYSKKGEPWRAFVAALSYKFTEAKDSFLGLFRRFSL